MEGVAGKLIQLPAGLVFGGSKRTSPYDALLRSLATSEPGLGLEFGAARARAAVSARSKKLGIKVEFAEADGRLYVKLAPALEELKTGRRAAILTALTKFGPQTTFKLTALMRDKGDTVADAALVETILEQLARTGAVVKRDGAAGEWGIGAVRKPG